MKITLNKNQVEEGLNELIDKQKRIQERLNNHNAYSEHECEQRLDLIRQRNQNDYILKYLFNLQTFQYCKDDFEGVEIQ